MMPFYHSVINSLSFAVLLLQLFALAVEKIKTSQPFVVVFLCHPQSSFSLEFLFLASVFHLMKKLYCDILLLEFLNLGNNTTRMAEICRKDNKELRYQSSGNERNFGIIYKNKNFSLALKYFQEIGEIFFLEKTLLDNSRRMKKIFL